MVDRSFILESKKEKPEEEDEVLVGRQVAARSRSPLGQAAVPLCSLEHANSVAGTKTSSSGEHLESWDESR